MHGNNEHEYCLRGIIYFGYDHFTSCIITHDNMCWYHDGIITGNVMEYEGYMSSLNDVTECRGRHAGIAIYTLVD